MRETWKIVGRLATEYAVHYPATRDVVGVDVGWEGPCPKYDKMIHEDRVRPSIHMPRWASRLLREITKVRVERVQDISEEDAKAEGTESPLQFSGLWDTINQSRGYGWSANPWVWCVSFRRIEHEIRKTNGT